MLLVTILGVILIVLGLWGMLTQKNIIKIIIGFSIMDTGIHLLIVSIGYIKDKTAPIMDIVDSSQVVDPVPSALVLTAIVIGLAVTALMLTYAIKLFEIKESLDINDFKELKW